ARERKSDPQRNGRRGVAEVMNRVRQQRDAAGKPDDDDLKQGGAEQPDERPLDRPDAARRGEYGRINGAMRMTVSAARMAVRVGGAVIMRISMPMSALTRFSVFMHRGAFLRLKIYLCLRFVRVRRGPRGVEFLQFEL